MKKLKQQNAITLVALVITIIILLILAGISIAALTNQGLFKQAQNAKNVTEEKAAEENEILRQYEETIKTITKGDPSISTNPATTIAEAQSDYMLTKTVNSQIQDEYGNRITVPAGFKIKSDASTNYVRTIAETQSDYVVAKTAKLSMKDSYGSKIIVTADSTTNNQITVDKGIVILDINGNEFVWIPIGKIYTDEARTEANAKNINLNRYTFGYGNPVALNDDLIDGMQELATSTFGNTTAKDINDFKTKASRSGGFYIGRYEARKSSSGVITENKTDNVWNNITQPNAAIQARNMFDNTKPFTSDLMNSYAWDTATLFLQTFGTNPKYSIGEGVTCPGTVAQKGTYEAQCNVYDMLCNVWEWTTETYAHAYSPYVIRGGYSGWTAQAEGREMIQTSVTGDNYGFRPILYM